MNSTEDYKPKAIAANNLRKIVDRIRVWEEKKLPRRKLSVYGDDYGNIKDIREEQKI